jgi:hypothetical protein
MAVISLLGGDVTIYDFSENRQGRIKWTGAATGTRTLRELYSAIQKSWDDQGNMDQPTPIRAITPTQYQIQGTQDKPFFIDDDTVEHLKGGSLFSSGWISGTTKYIKTIGADFATAFSADDIGRTLLGGTTGDTATLLDYNSGRGLLWIRPDDPTQTTGDDFDNPTEAYSVKNDAAAVVWQVAAGGPTFVDETADFNSAANADFQPFPTVEAANDYCAFGFALKFSKLIFDYANGTAGVGGTVAWEYWNGTAWAALSGVTDGTTSFTAAVGDGKAVTWTAPSDWATTTLNGSAQLYYVRARVTGTYSTNPVLDQGFIAGQGTGNFKVHPRHGGGAQGGESAWAGITTIGAIQENTKAYIFQENKDTPSGSGKEIKVVATKGTSEWWNQEGHIDVLLKTKESGSVIGPLPGGTTAVATFLMRQFTKTYSHFLSTALGTSGGETVVPFGTGTDLNVTQGYRQLSTNAETGAGWSSSDVGAVVQKRGTQSAWSLVLQVDSSPETFVDQTTNANSAGTNDYVVFPASEATGDYAAFGYTTKFNKLEFDYASGTAGVGGVVTWEYWNGTTWSALTSVTDNTTSFTAAVGNGKLVVFLEPLDWATTSLNNSVPLYFVRARITTIYSTNPVLDRAYVYPVTNNKAILTSVSGTGPNYTIQYYLVGLGTDFANTDVVEHEYTNKSFTVTGAPSDVNSAALAITPTFGATTENINNGSGARPYSVRINPATNLLTAVYPRLQYLTRRLSTTLLQTQTGEEYLGNELQVQYTSQANGNFSEGRFVYSQNSDGLGIIVADHDDGTSGDLILKAVRGTFTNGDIISDSPDATQTLGTALQVDASPLTIVDQTTAAQSAGGADVTPFPASEATGDYFAIGAAKPFARVSIDIATSGVGGVGTWEYWDGTTWQTLETVPNFSDGTSDLTAAPGFSDLVFYPPIDWEKTTLAAGTASYGPYYMIRLRVTTVYTTNPILDEVQIKDWVTATVNGIPRVIVPVAAAPFGTFAGGKLFGAPGVTLTTANLNGADVQAYQLIDDDGTTQIPPNTIGVTVSNLVSGDTVAIYRRTGNDINKTQFTLAAGNNLGDTSVDVTTTIATDNPQTANSKIRIISQSNQEHRYRYASYSGTTFTLSTASTGTATAGSTLTTVIRATGSFITDGVEEGDMIRNTTNGTSYSFVVSVDSATQLTVTNNGVSWSSQAYSINTLVENYPSGQNLYVPILEVTADATTESTQLIFSSSFDVRVVVRRSDDSNPILPYTQDTSITGTVTFSAIRNSDDIIS